MSTLMMNNILPMRVLQNTRILQPGILYRRANQTFQFVGGVIRYSTSQSDTPTTHDGALKGLKVLDLSRVLAAPFCTQILADYGADVVKIEAVAKGDDTRHWMMPGEPAKWDPEAGPMSNYFSSVNRNKRSVTLNLKSPKGKAILVDLARKADVLYVVTNHLQYLRFCSLYEGSHSVENFKPGTMDRLGLGYERLKKLNPRLVYASLSGYGTSGPYANRGGYDPIAGAEAGLLHVTGEQHGPPVRPGLGLVDMATGLYMHGAILAALHARERTGTGQRVDGSLFETQISLLTNVGLSWLNLGIEAKRWGCQHPSIVPYDAFKTKDHHLVCGATNDAQFAKLCKLLGLEVLIKDERFATNPKRVENRNLLRPIFNAAFEKKSTAEWIAKFEGTNLPFAPINNMERTFSHPQAEARDMITKMPLASAITGAALPD
ncbi:Succinate--hydroxymethylglutarate CoA-transferase [Colletotrichum scovillei]|nr:Succinate--hydroxymethylglutarate CoA-transferase [Colletotrichum scovillei]